jgi:hypothetical protein
VTLAVLAGSAWPYPYMRLMSVTQRLVYLVANCALAAWSYSLAESINSAVWGETQGNADLTNISNLFCYFIVY